jgi:hypothetical protein
MGTVFKEVICKDPTICRPPAFGVQMCDGYDIALDRVSNNHILAGSSLSPHLRDTLNHQLGKSKTPGVTGVGVEREEIHRLPNLLGAGADS